MSKSFERTYEIDLPGPYADLSSQQMGTLTRRLRADARSEGVGTLGDTTVVRRAGLIGGTSKVTVRASVEQTSADEPAGDDAGTDDTEA